jgi:macrophage erythroblast attacher
MQEFIELCRQRKVKEAIVYSRKNLAPWAATHLVALQQAMTLLAFGEKSGVNAYRVSPVSRQSSSLTDHI